jgi:hypothetical protein
VVAYVEREEGNTLAELLERRPDHGIFRDYTISAGSYICQVPAHYRSFIHYYFTVKHDVLTSAKHRLSIYL